jgi:hypothetical protein
MKCKSLTGVVVALGALASLHPAYAWDWYHTPMCIVNNTSYVWTHIHNDAGWYAKIESTDGKFPDQVAPGQSLNTLATWRYTGNGWDWDNAAEIFFTCNGVEHSLQIKGEHSDCHFNSGMYIRFYKNSQGISDDSLVIKHVEYNRESGSFANVEVEDGYRIAKSAAVGQYDDIYIGQR